MRCIVVVIVVLMKSWPTVKASKTCKYPYQCTGSYKSCCDRKCDYRRFCNNYCSRRTDCAPNQYCVNNNCTEDKPSNYCHSDTLCQANNHCVNNRCVPYCHCGVNEECIDGKCINPTKSVFTPAAIAGFVVAAVILGCIFCVIYCRCAAGRANRHATQQQQQQLSALRREGNLGTESTGRATNQPVHPGGPPTYDSLGRNERGGMAPPPSYKQSPNHPSVRTAREEELPAPPSYEEAVQNSHNNLNV